MCDSSSESESQNLLFYLLINAQIASAIHFLGGFQGSLKNGTLRYIHSVRKLKQIIRINFVFLHCYSNTQMSILDPSELLPWVGWTEKCLYFSSMQNTQMEMQSITQDMQKLTLSLFLRPYPTLPGRLSLVSVTLLLSQLSHSEANLVLRIRNVEYG